MIAKKALVIFTLILTVSSVLSGPVFAISDPLLEAGINAYQKGNFDEAKTSFNELLKSSRWNFAALYNLGNIAVRQKHLGEALGYYERALQARPHDRDVIFNVKYVEDALGNRRFAGKLTNYELIRQNFLNRFILNEALLAVLIVSIGFLMSLTSFLKKRKQLKSEDASPSPVPPPTTIIAGILLIIFIAASALKFVDTYSERGIITASKTDLRSGPGEANASMEEVQEGTEVTVLDSSGDWKQVTFPNSGLAGWIPANHMMLTSGGGPF